MYSAIASFNQGSECNTVISLHSIAAQEPCQGYPEEHSPTLVLQPSGDLNQDNSNTFQQELENALELATESVIIDFLWTNRIDAFGIAALVAGVEKAVCLGKRISFQAMSRQTQVAMEVEWERQRQARFGSWRDRFASSLEQFLDQGRRR